MPLRQLFFCCAFTTTTAVLANAAPPPGAAFWNELKAKRAALPVLHQEFEFTRNYRTGYSEQPSMRRLIVDISGDTWREQFVSGSGTRIRVFDGHDLFITEDGSDEFVRVKRKATDDPLPAPYNPNDPDWSRAKEVSRGNCGLPGKDHQCVVLDVPLKSRAQIVSNTILQKAPTVIPTQGTERFVADVETGMLVSVRIVEMRQNKGTSYRADFLYALRRASYGKSADASLFSLPVSQMHEVKELSKWNAARMMKELSGKAAPELELTDIDGNPVNLADFRGKTVLLDFWASWCPPCREDGPALDKLFRKFKDRDFAIIGISVSEDRAVVEKYLKDTHTVFRWC
jgi:thiol-disulfide isomerase/thioredoxin